MTTGTRPLALVFALIATLTLAACGGSPAAESPQGNDKDAPKATTYTVKTVDGATLTVPDGKPVAAYFFSLTCGHCVKAGKAFVAARAKLSDQATFLLVDANPTETNADVDKFRDLIGGKDVPAAFNKEAKLMQAWGVDAMTTIVVLDATGKVSYQRSNPTLEEMLTAVDEAARG
ncbi:MAG: TlpA family protein disulfide reductase [Micromonosporaceae bacterium]